MLNTDGCVSPAGSLPCNPPGNAPVGICSESNQRVARSARNYCAAVAGCARKIVERGNDVARDFRVGFRISREQAVIGRNAAIGALRIENPAQQ